MRVLLAAAIAALPAVGASAAVVSIGPENSEGRYPTDELFGVSIHDTDGWYVNDGVYVYPFFYGYTQFFIGGGPLYISSATPFTLKSIRVRNYDYGHISQAPVPTSRFNGQVLSATAQSAGGEEHNPFLFEFEGVEAVQGVTNVTIDWVYPAECFVPGEPQIYGDGLVVAWYECGLYDVLEVVVETLDAPAPVPLPAGGVLLAGALGALAWRRRT